MSFSIGGLLKKAVKVATLPITAPIKLQAQIGSKLLSTVARAVPGVNPFSRSSAPAGAPPAAPVVGAPVGWRGMSLAPIQAASTAAAAPVGWRSSAAATDPSQAPTPAQSSWFPSIATAVQATPPSSAPLPYGATTPYPGYTPGQPYVPGGVPGGTPLSYAQPGYSPPPPSSYGGGGDYGYGGGGGGGGGYGGGGGGGDPYSTRGDPSVYDLTPEEYGSDSTDDEQLGDADPTAIDYAAFLADADYGLGDWKSGLLSVVKGAASGALSSTVNALAPKPAAPKPGLLGGGMSTGAKLAIAAAIALPVGYLVLHRRPAPAKARNPRRRRRARRKSRR